MRDRQHVAQLPVHAVPDLEHGLLRLDVDVAGPGGRGVAQNQVHQPHDRRQLDVFGQRLRIDEIVLAALSRAEPLTRRNIIDVSLEPDLPLVRVDAHSVAEVVYTLVDNAAKYSPPGSRIRVTANRAGDDMLRLAVENEGVGIPPELRERVFDKFFRAMRDGDSGTSGTGMGLAIARGIVEAHGGRIWVEDRNGKSGTVVALTLPVGDRDEAAEETASEPEINKTS